MTAIDVSDKLADVQVELLVVWQARMRTVANLYLNGCWVSLVVERLVTAVHMHFSICTAAGHAEVVFPPPECLPCGGRRAAVQRQRVVPHFMCGQRRRGRGCPAARCRHRNVSASPRRPLRCTAMQPGSSVMMQHCRNTHRGCSISRGTLHGFKAAACAVAKMGP